MEVTTKSRDDLSRLHDELEVALQGRSVVAELRVSRKLVIPDPQRQVACARVLAAVEAMTDSYCSVGLPEIGGSVTLNTPSIFGGPHVVLDSSSDLAAHGQAVERFVLNAIAEKSSSRFEEVGQLTRCSWWMRPASA